MQRAQIRWALSSLALLIHLAVAHRYDFFRDELYFIACGRHPAFGYMDQPPLVPLLAAATQIFGQHLVLLRAAAGLGAFGVVWFTCKLAELLEAGPLGVAIAGVAAATAPMFMGLTGTLGTSTFEPLAWTALTFFVARAAVFGDERAWLWAGLVVGLDLETKYALPLYLAPLLAALVLTGRGRALLSRHALAGAALAAAIALPSAIWQVGHGLPFLELMRAGASGKNTVVPPAAFVLNQVLVMNPVYAALALAGMVAPFLDRRFKPWRFVSVAFASTFALMIVLHAKDYYLAPAYGPVLALGGASVDRWIRPRWLKLAPLVPALALSAVAAPLALPILDPPKLAAYMRALYLKPKSGENLDQSDIPQTFADMLGWRPFVHSVAVAYRSLPADEQKRAAILGRNYGEAAALDFFGPAEGLPPAIGRHNQYWLWGPRGHDGSLLILINWEPERVSEKCQTATLLGRFGGPHVMPFENDAPITLCRGLKRPLAAEWPGLKLIL
jgi:Dolichyl-phosphate-mannose-protein mannosyltransferase